MSNKPVKVGKPVKSDAAGKRVKKVEVAQPPPNEPSVPAIGALSTVNSEQPAVEPETNVKPKKRSKVVKSDPIVNDEDLSTHETEDEEKKPETVLDALLQEKEKYKSLTAFVRMLTIDNKDNIKLHQRELRAKPKKRKHGEQNKEEEQKFDVKEPLRQFLHLGPDEKIGKTSAHKAISAYIREHDLLEHSDRRIIKPDGPLLELFGPPRHIITKEKGNGYSNLNVRRYIKDYFIDNKRPHIVEEKPVENPTIPIAAETPALPTPTVV